MLGLSMTRRDNASWAWMPGLTIILVLGLATPAAAQFGGLKSLVSGASKEAKKKAGQELREVRKLLLQGKAALPRRIGSNPAAEKASLEKAEALLKRGQAAFKSSHKSHATYKAAKQDAANLAAAISVFWLQHACGVVAMEINGVHNTGQVAPDRLLDALDKCVAKLASNLPGGYEDSAKFWQRKARDLRVKNPEIARAAKENAAREAKRDAQKHARAVKRAISDATKAVTTFTSVGEEPISAEALAGYEKAMGDAAKIHPAALANLQLIHKEYALYNALKENATDDISSLLEGSVLTKGASKGNKAKVSFKAEAGHCYMILLSWRTYTKGVRMKDPGITGDYSKMQFFKFDYKYPGLKTRGVCVIKPVKVTWSTELTFAGSRNGLNYTVLKWSKDKFPGFVASQTSVKIADMCDTKLWSSMWLDPVPGSLVWVEKEPFLVQHSNKPDSTYFNAWNISGQSVRGAIEKVLARAKAPKTRSVKAAFKRPKCAGHTKASKKLNGCYDKIHTKYAKQASKLDKQKKYARRIGSYRRAQKKRDKIYSKRAAEFERKCGPLNKKMNKLVEKTFNNLVDHFIDNGGDSALDVPAIWKAASGN